MLSILIPLYNQHPEGLVRSLALQIQHLKTEIEIILLDDGSEPTYKEKNQKIEWPPFLQYAENERNLGRSASRNILARKAQFPFLLFLDGDSEIIRDDFLRVYLKNLSKNRVLTGGRIYPSICPDRKYKLHWSYGKFREGRETGAFQSNNFVIPAECFLHILFDESLKTYGHEDTIFGFQLIQHQVEVISLDNPVLHGELQENEIFLKNQEYALINLKKIQKFYPGLETTLTRTAEKLEKLKVATVIRSSASRLLPLLSQCLKVMPWLWLLDLYKVTFFLRVKKPESIKQSA